MTLFSESGQRLQNVDQTHLEQDSLVCQNEKRIKESQYKKWNPQPFWSWFSGLSDDFRFPAGFFEPETLFSSVLRVSSAGIRVWTHYDVLDNFYVQVRARIAS